MMLVMIGKGLDSSQVAHQARTYPGYHKATKPILLPLDGMLVHRRAPPPVALNSPVLIYTPGWRVAL